MFINIQIDKYAPRYSWGDGTYKMDRLLTAELCIRNHTIYLPEDIRRRIIKSYRDETYLFFKNNIPREFGMFKTALMASMYADNLTNEHRRKGNRYVSLMPYCPEEEGGSFVKTLTLFNVRNMNSPLEDISVCIHVEWIDKLQTFFWRIEHNGGTIMGEKCMGRYLGFPEDEWWNIFKMGHRIQFSIWDWDAEGDWFQVKCWAEVHNKHLVFQSDYNRDWDNCNINLPLKYCQGNIKILKK